MSIRLIKILLFCLLGVCILAEARLPTIKPGVPGKKKGEIIAPMLDEQVAAWCDFNKQIIITRSNILCAYVGDKGLSTVTAASAPPPLTARDLPPLADKVPIAKKMVKAKPIPRELTPTLYEMNEYGDA